MTSAKVLCEAIKSEDIATIENICTTDINFSDTDEQGLTPLMWLAIKDLSNFVPTFVKTGASLEDTDGLGRTALMWAAEMGHMTTAQALVEDDWLAVARAKSGHTPLWYAEWQEDNHLASYLKAAGACA